MFSVRRDLAWSRERSKGGSEMDACLRCSAHVVSFRFDSIRLRRMGCEDGVDVAEKEACRGWEGGVNVIVISSCSCSCLEHGHKMTASRGLRGQDCPMHMLRRRRAAVIIVLITCQVSKKRWPRQHDAVTPPAQPWEKRSKANPWPLRCAVPPSLLQCVRIPYMVFISRFYQRRCLKRVVGLRLSR